MKARNARWKDCTERAIGCHSVCESYKEFRAAKDAEISAREKVRAVANYNAERGRRVAQLERKKRGYRN